MIDGVNNAYLRNRCQKLEEKLERIKTLIENFPSKCCLNEAHYCVRDAWFEELKK